MILLLVVLRVQNSTRAFVGFFSLLVRGLCCGWRCCYLLEEMNDTQKSMTFLISHVLMCNVCVHEVYIGLSMRRV
jgi:hypothetical protein